MEAVFTQEKLLAVLLLIIFGVAIRYTVGLARQNWIKTYSHTITLIMLPLVTYSITSVISGNIALSLGMVGALSIVRFRNPVKSPFELAIYFLMISLGICAAVDIGWMIFLGTSAVVVILGCEYVAQHYKSRTGNDLFTASFTEGNSLNTLVVESAEPIPLLEEHGNLIALSRRGESHTYRLASSSRDDLLVISKTMRGDGSISAVDFNAA